VVHPSSWSFSYPSIFISWERITRFKLFCSQNSRVTSGPNLNEVPLGLSLYPLTSPGSLHSASHSGPDAGGSYGLSNLRNSSSVQPFQTPPCTTNVWLFRTLQIGSWAKNWSYNLNICSLYLCLTSPWNPYIWFILNVSWLPLFKNITPFFTHFLLVSRID